MDKITTSELLLAFFLVLLPYFEISSYGFLVITMIRISANENAFIMKITKYPLIILGVIIFIISLGFLVIITQEMLNWNILDSGIIKILGILFLSYMGYYIIKLLKIAKNLKKIPLKTLKP